MSKKRKTGLAIGAAACIAVLCAAEASIKTSTREKAVQREIVTTAVPSSQTIERIITTLRITTVPVTTTTESTAITTVPPQITTAVTCSATEQTTTTTTTEQTAAADTTVQLTTTTAPATTMAPALAEPYNGQTSGDYIYCIGFSWLFNEGGGGYGETNYDMYCNGNKIGYL